MCLTLPLANPPARILFELLYNKINKIPANSPARILFEFLYNLNMDFFFGVGNILLIYIDFFFFTISEFVYNLSIEFFFFVN